MENFTAHNPTALHFGKGVVHDLGSTIALFGKKVLLIYGRSSIKQNGIYDEVMHQLNKVKAEVYEYSGIRPNPIVEDVDAAAALGRAKDVDVVLAVGGGSVIDSAKMTCVTIPVFHSVWDFYTGKAKADKAIPLVCILTLAATGTEMNQFAVLQNNRTHQKWGWGSPLIYPRHSFLDPLYTASVPREYTAYGIADLSAHALESYFGAGDASLSDEIVYGVIREAMRYGPLLLRELDNYEYRAKILYASTLALNGYTLYGRVSGDWGVHGAGHVLSVLWDVPHGASLTIVYPAWLRLMKERIPARIAQLGENLFGTSDVDATTDRLESFFRSIECPVRMSDMKLPADQDELIIQTLMKNKVDGRNLKLSEADYGSLVSLMA